MKPDGTVIENNKQETNMHDLIHSTSLKRLLVLESPALLLALVVAEFFYKFGSFTLECLAFLPTWYAFSSLFHAIASRTGLATKLQ